MLKTGEREAVASANIPLDGDELGTPVQTLQAAWSYVGFSLFLLPVTLSCLTNGVSRVTPLSKPSTGV